MAKNLVQDGGVLNWTNVSGGTVTSGSVVRIGHTIAIALATIANGATGAVDCTPGRVFTVPKVSAAVFVAGEKLLWDASAAAFDDAAATPATGDLMGAVIAAKPGANAELTCEVMLTPGNATLT
jgi:predicted RecA/RadA family phage recombinase